MANPKKEIPRSCGKISYDLEGLGGGVGVFWVDGDYGTKIIAIPRLGVSTVLLGNTSDRSMLIQMLRKGRNFYFSDKKTEELADMILRDIKGFRVV